MNGKPSFPGGRPQLVEPAGWFAAGRSFRRAMEQLSDGAFKLFAYLCLEADRHSGQLQITQKQLAGAVGKSKRAIGTYLEELRQKGLCFVLHGRNQHASSCLRITDAYWPYHRLPYADRTVTESQEEREYVSVIREAFLAMGCSYGKFGAADIRMAQSLQHRGIPLAVVKDAILVATCRKYISWMNGGVPQVIGSLQYIEPLIAEVSEQPLEESYRYYLRSKVQQLAKSWNLTHQDRQTPPGERPDAVALDMVP